MIFNKISFRVRYAETDQMGVVYHGNYAQYLELGRVEWLRELGISYKKLEKNGIILPVISLNCIFKKSAYYDDLITVETTLVKLPVVKIAFDYKIYNQDRDLLITASTVLAFVEQSTMRPIKCPENMMQLMKNAVKE